MEEAKISSSCTFLTFTYAETPMSENGLPTLVKDDYQLFMKRLRKHPDIHTKLKYYACGEYGTETHRPHYHAIMFNLPLHFIDQEKIAGVWQKGHVDVAQGNELTMRYVTKYIMKSHFHRKPIVDTNTGEIVEDDRQKEFSLMSKKMGLNFLTPKMVKHLKENLTGHVMINGYATPLPRYFRDKIYTPTEKQIINQLAAEARTNKLLKSFKDDPILENEWRKDQVRKHLKSIKNERAKI